MIYKELRCDGSTRYISRTGSFIFFYWGVRQSYIKYYFRVALCFIRSKLPLSDIKCLVCTVFAHSEERWWFETQLGKVKEWKIDTDCFPG